MVYWIGQLLVRYCLKKQDQHFSSMTTLYEVYKAYKQKTSSKLWSTNMYSTNVRVKIYSSWSLPVTAISNDRKGPQHCRVQQSFFSAAKKTCWPIEFRTLYLFAVSKPVNASSNSTCCLTNNWSTCRRYSEKQWILLQYLSSVPRPGGQFGGGGGGCIHCCWPCICISEIEKSRFLVTIGPSRALSVELSMIQVFVRFVSSRYYLLLPRRHLIQSRKVRLVSDLWYSLFLFTIANKRGVHSTKTELQRVI